MNRKMKIIVTANGEGSRFKKEGFITPKYKIIANSKSLFYWSVLSLKNFFDNSLFIFVFNKKIYDKDFVKNELCALNIKKYKIIVLNKLTDGQATTTMQANKYVKDHDSFIVYNIDTYIKLNKKINQKFLLSQDILAITTKAKGENWSFIKYNKKNIAIDASEKIRISDEACTGFYFFKQWKYFKDIYLKYINEIKKNYKEAYIAPMYKYMIEKGLVMKKYTIPLKKFIVLGTPKEVEEWDKNFRNYNT